MQIFWPWRWQMARTHSLTPIGINRSWWQEADRGGGERWQGSYRLETLWIKNRQEKHSHPFKACWEQLQWWLNKQPHGVVARTEAGWMVMAAQSRWFDGRVPTFQSSIGASCLYNVANFMAKFWPLTAALQSEQRKEDNMPNRCVDYKIWGLKDRRYK